MDTSAWLNEFTSLVGTWPFERRRRLYGILATGLTVEIRISIGDTTLKPAVKLKQIDALNEALHRIISKLSQSEHFTPHWPEGEFWRTVADFASMEPLVLPRVIERMKYAFQSTLDT